jgi:hypothetical protein
MVSKIDFNMENLKKCICYTCPVQVESACAKENSGENEMEMPESDPESDGSWSVLRHREGYVHRFGLRTILSL